MKKQILATAVISAALLGFSANQAQAATISVSSHGTSYLRKGDTYKLHLKEAGRVRITTKAKYKLGNSIDWNCIPYKTSRKNTKEFYLRAGNYKLTTSSKSAKSFKTSFTKLTKIRKQIDDYPIYKKDWPIHNPAKIKLGQEVKGFTDLFKSYRNGGVHYYQFTLTKPQKVTLTMSGMPLYTGKASSNVSDTNVSLDPQMRYTFDPSNFKVKGEAYNQKHVWYLDEGTYRMSVSVRGRFDFKLAGEDTDQLPCQGKITAAKSTKDGLQVDYDQAEGAENYSLYLYNNPFKNKLSDQTSPIYRNWLIQNNDLSQTIKTNYLVNGVTYQLAVRGEKEVAGSGKVYGPVSEPYSFTYYAPLGKNHQVPAMPNLKVSYYDDHGSDEPYIDLDWQKQVDIDSYEVAFRVKGQKEWTTFFSKQQGGEQIDNSEDKDNICYFTKGKTYEVKVRALRSNLKSPWSAVKTATVTVTPAGKMVTVIMI
ncbi:hypothetical protein [Lactobacillus sp. HT06-2]|uniref:hypothetical protein n=1 Tax=Lactobacillus sp. HT06-2 TaxID=2080222 RepID=UPI000CD94118|nr:hypothetical protein [Lactobacillus sp. HT06-2]